MRSQYRSRNFVQAAPTTQLPFLVRASPLHYRREVNQKEHYIDSALEACTALGLDGSGARLMRRQSSALIELPAADVIARVEPAERLESAQRQVSAARFYAQRGAPVMRLVCGHAQPWIGTNAVVTLWERLHSTGRVVGPKDLGRLIRAVHDATGPPFPKGLSLLDPFFDIGWWLAHPGSAIDGLRLQALCELANQLRERWPMVCKQDPLGIRMVHADVHIDNIVLTQDGPKLVDLEMSGLGPAGFDLAVPAVGARRYGHSPEHYKQVLKAYGATPGDWEGFNDLCTCYALLTTAWAIHCSDRSPKLLREARLRTAGLLDGTAAIWTLM